MKEDEVGRSSEGDGAEVLWKGEKKRKNNKASVFWSSKRSLRPR